MTPPEVKSCNNMGNSDSGIIIFFFSSRRRHTRFDCDWSSDVCSSDLKPCGGEKRSDIAATAAVPAIVTGRMIVVLHRELSAAVGQIRDTDFFGSLLNDVINTAKRHGRQILAIGISGPILNRAGHAHVS